MTAEYGVQSAHDRVKDEDFVRAVNAGGTQQSLKASKAIDRQLGDIVCMVKVTVASRILVLNCSVWFRACHRPCVDQTCIRMKRSL